MSARLTRIPWSTWRPKLVECLAGYSRADFGADLVAGVTVGLVALPLAMAFGIASGTTPQAGIYTAIVGGFLVAGLGGSKIQVSGPTGAFVAIVAGIIAKHGMSGLLTVTMMAGVVLLFLAFSGLGKAIRYIPRPIVIGFTNGIALLIVSTQIKDFLGLSIGTVPSEFFERMRAFGEHLDTTQWPTLAMGAGSLLVIVAAPLVSKRVPGAIVALVLGTGLTALLGLPVETIGTRFGGIPHGLPAIAIPEFRPDLLLPLLPSALTVAILAAVESLLSAVVADSMSGDRHNANAELMAQGVANVIVPLIGGIPVTGAIARTATNFRSGARTPVAALVHAVTLLCVVVVLAPLASYTPLATLAAVLFVVAYNMGEWREIPDVLRLEVTDKAVWLITLVLTLVADLTVAVEVGLLLAALLYVYRVSETTTVSLVTPDYIERGRVHTLQDKDVPPYVSILRIHGPFLFGTTEKLAEVTAHLDALQPIVIVRLRNMTAIDATGLHALEQLAERLAKSGRRMLLCGARVQPREYLERAEIADVIGKDNILPHVRAALERAQVLHSTLVTSPRPVPRSA
ncbi:MAG: SulP family inorganic anion transporter [Vicinamibacterales bacterium]